MHYPQMDLVTCAPQDDPCAHAANELHSILQRHANISHALLKKDTVIADIGDGKRTGTCDKNTL